jgi:hypothetical protein
VMVVLAMVLLGTLVGCSSSPPPPTGGTGGMQIPRGLPGGPTGRTR